METMNLDLINALTKVLTNYIDQQVEKKIANILATDEQRIKDIAQAEAQEAIIEHLGNEEHKDESDIEDIVDNKLDDHDFSDAIENALANYDFSDNIKQVLNDSTISLSID
jgi:hypothetical protein